MKFEWIFFRIPTTRNHANQMNSSRMSDTWIKFTITIPRKMQILRLFYLKRKKKPKISTKNCETLFSEDARHNTTGNKLYCSYYSTILHPLYHCCLSLIDDITARRTFGNVRHAFQYVCTYMQAIACLEKSKFIIAAVSTVHVFGSGSLRGEIRFCGLQRYLKDPSPRSEKQDGLFQIHWTESLTWTVKESNERHTF